MSSALILPLVLALSAAPVVFILGRARTALAAPAAVALAAASFVTLLWAYLQGGPGLDLAWSQTLGLRLTFELDGLAALYGLLATGIGTLVLAYSSSYIPSHLEHQGREGNEAVRFYFFILLFMGSMVGLAMAQDFILLFLFWDLTAIASYYLIGFDNRNEEARASAHMALTVTGVTAVFLLVGAILLGSEYGTFNIAQLIRVAESGPLLTTAALLIAVAGLAKSAQFPLHFWLPRAMAAPTPVSAYLHSAAMVAAGVFLLARTYPLLQQSQALQNMLLVIGLLSILYGGIIALTRNALKQVLAYSTIAQYGYVVVFYGLGGPYGAAGAAFYVIAHGIAKSALFLTAGTVTETTGEKNLSELGGLGRRMPLLAISSGLAAATLVSLPFTIGFFKDEFFFAAALERGTIYAVFTVLAAASTVAYTWRFWSGIFLGKAPEREPARAPRRLVLPITLLGLTGLVGGFYTAPFASLAVAAGDVTLGAPTSLDASYHLELLPEYLMAAAAFAVGTLIIVTRPFWAPAAQSLAQLDRFIGAERVYIAAVRGLNSVSDAVHNLEVRRLRSRVGSVLVPTGILVLAGLIATGTARPFVVGELNLEDVPIITALVLAAVAAFALGFTRRHLALAAVLSGFGFTLAVIYAFWGAPNVALVAVLIETMLTLLLVGAMALVPKRVLGRQAQEPIVSSKRTTVIAILTGLIVFPTAWSALSFVPTGELLANTFIDMAPMAHALNVVTAILADFRGLDTMGEITVVALALLGVGSLVADITPEDVRRHSQENDDDDALAAAREGRPETSLFSNKQKPLPASRVVLQGIARLLYLPILMIAAALLVKGFVDTGDGFSAGMVAALGVLMRILAFRYKESKKLPIVRHARAVAFSGLLLALGTTFIPLLFGQAPLTHWPPSSVTPIHIGSIELMTAVLFDIGVFALVLGFGVGVLTNIARIANRDLKRGVEP